MILRQEGKSVRIAADPRRDPTIRLGFSTLGPNDNAADSSATKPPFTAGNKQRT